MGGGCDGGCCGDVSWCGLCGLCVAGGADGSVVEGMAQLRARDSTVRFYRL